MAAWKSFSLPGLGLTLAAKDTAAHLGGVVGAAGGLIFPDILIGWPQQNLRAEGRRSGVGAKVWGSIGKC